ncbi:hypothetical protein ASE69_13680 [Sphingomonas sp. Leaf208]|nr:hypothetical protein ASE69_13680 [Sphingomonas sp. Leaf208]
MNPSRRLTIAGWVATGGYLTAIALYVWWIWPNFEAMKPDEFATFLSGVFAPLAFLWLVLGFIQQGTELRHSSEALRLQGEELRNSVEQQRHLVEVSREQLAWEQRARELAEADTATSAQPRFIISNLEHSTSAGARSYRFGLTNAGRTCSQFRLSFAGQHPPQSLPLFASNQQQEFVLDYLPGVPVEDVQVDMAYVDERGIRGQRTAKLVASHPPGGDLLSFDGD